MFPGQTIMKTFYVLLSDSSPLCCNIVMTLLTYECMEGIGLDSDQEQSDWVHTVCFYLHESYMQQMT